MKGSDDIERELKQAERSEAGPGSSASRALRVQLRQLCRRDIVDFCASTGFGATDTEGRADAIKKLCARLWTSGVYREVDWLRKQVRDSGSRARAAAVHAGEGPVFKKRAPVAAGATSSSTGTTLLSPAAQDARKTIGRADAAASSLLVCLTEATQFYRDLVAAVGESDGSAPATTAVPGRGAALVIRQCSLCLGDLGRYAAECTIQRRQWRATAAAAAAANVGGGARAASDAPPLLHPFRLVAAGGASASAGDGDEVTRSFAGAPSFVVDSAGAADSDGQMAAAWLSAAMAWYWRAAALDPDSGHPYNQMGVLLMSVSQAHADPARGLAAAEAAAASSSSSSSSSPPAAGRKRVASPVWAASVGRRVQFELLACASYSRAVGARNPWPAARKNLVSVLERRRLAGAATAAAVHNIPDNDFDVNPPESESVMSVVCLNAVSVLANLLVYRRPATDGTSGAAPASGAQPAKDAAAPALTAALRSARHAFGRVSEEKPLSIPVSIALFSLVTWATWELGSEVGRSAPPSTATVVAGAHALAWETLGAIARSAQTSDGSLPFSVLFSRWIQTQHDSAPESPLSLFVRPTPPPGCPAASAVQKGWKAALKGLSRCFQLATVAANDDGDDYCGEMASGHDSGALLAEVRLFAGFLPVFGSVVPASTLARCRRSDVVLQFAQVVGPAVARDRGVQVPWVLDEASGDGDRFSVNPRAGAVVATVPVRAANSGGDVQNDDDDDDDLGDEVILYRHGV